MAKPFTTCLTFVTCLAAVGCSDALAPEAVLGTWELVAVNGAPVPGTVVVGGRTLYIEHDRFVVLTIADVGDNGSSTGTCRQEYSSFDVTATLTECTYTFDRPSEILTIILNGSLELQLALDGDEAVLEAFGPVGSLAQADDEIVYRKK
jgi:hypothetical protein